jgi:hypothetical protein
MNKLIATLLLASLATASAANLKPLLTKRGSIVLQDDFSAKGKPDKANWLSRQGTRWEKAEGVLRGIESSPEYQAKKTHHRGLEPRTSVPKTPAEFVIKISFRFLDGEENAIVPFVEFGHHICRLKFSSTDGLSLIAEGETVKLAEAKDFKYESGKWYHVLAEMKGENFVIQFADGPTLYAKHKSFAKPPASGGNGLGLAGPRKGMVEIDNVSIWKAGAMMQPNWAKTRADLPKFKPVPTGKVKKKK